MMRRLTLQSALSLISFSVLLFEILLTRIFSVVLLYHFAYVAVSLALLGFSFGALFVYYRPALHDPARIRRTVIVHSSCFSLSILACTLFLIHFRPGGVDLYTGLNLPTLRYLIMIYGVATLPFIMAGICVSALLAAGRDAIGRFYCFDLLGAAAGAVAVIPIINTLGAPSAMLVAAATAAASGWLVTARQSWPVKSVPAVIVTVLVTTWILSLSQPVLTLRFTKGRLEHDNILFERWNSYSRVSAHPVAGNGISIRIDAGAATRIFPASMHANLANNDISTPAMRLRPNGDILIIGPGGGKEVAAAVALGLNSVTGVELNPIIAELVTDRYRAMSGGLYDRDNVRIITEEGRSFLNHTDQKFDIVMLTLVDTWAATAAGAFALSENNLYTVEAFSRYLEQLKDNGILSITRWYFPERPHETIRLLALGRAALQAYGISNPAQHCVVIQRVDLRRHATFLLKRSPFTAGELDALHALVRNQPNWEFIYSPSGKKNDPLFAQLAQTADADAFYNQYEFDVSPPSDDSPFFFYAIRPANVLASIRRDFHRLPNVTNIGVFLLASTLVVDVLFLALLIGVPFILQRRQGSRYGRGVLPVLGYFACLGAGFMIVELSLIQNFILFLGHPTHALTVVIFVLLLTSGLGSLYSGRLGISQAMSRLRVWIVSLVALGLASAWTLPLLFKWAIGFPMPVRIGISIICLAPTGFLLGTCFPTGVRLLGGRATYLLPWIWAINGGMSVLASAMAMMIAMNLGFRWTLCTALGIYLVALICAPACVHLASCESELVARQFQ